MRLQSSFILLVITSSSSPLFSVYSNISEYMKSVDIMLRLQPFKAYLRYKVTLLSSRHKKGRRQLSAPTFSISIYSIYNTTSPALSVCFTSIIRWLLEPRNAKFGSNSDCSNLPSTSTSISDSNSNLSSVSCSISSNV